MFPIKYIENNLVFNHDGECFAYYELTPYNYSFLSPEEKYMVHDNFRQLIAQNRDGKIHALQIATEDSLRAVQERSKKGITGRLKEIACKKVDEQTEALVEMIGENQIDYRFFLGFKLLVNEEEINLKAMRKSAAMTVMDFIYEVNHKLMGDFVSMSNDEINRFLKMEKLLESKISRRFQFRRLDKNDFGYLLEHIYGNTGVAYSDYSYDLPIKKLKRETLVKRYDLIRPTRCMIEENQRYLKIGREDQTTFVAYFTINNIVGELDFPSSEIFYYQQQQFTFPVSTSMNVEIVTNKKALTTVRNKKKELKDLDNHAWESNNETGSNVMDALDSVNELETNLDQSKESMYKLSYVIRVAADSLDELKRRCDEVKDFYDDLNVKLVRPFGDMLGLHGEFIPSSKRYINDYIQYVTSDFLAGLGFGATQQLGETDGIYIGYNLDTGKNVYLKEVIEQRIIDTNKIENFVKAFVKSYYSWSNTQESIDARTAAINNYLTKSLQDLNVDTVRQDIPTSSTVTDVKIWDIEQAGTDDFTVVYSVDQTVTEGETSIGYTSAYMVVVHVDGDGNMVITQNPTISSTPTKSSYEPKAKESDGTVDAATTEEVTEFLETFFKLYPTATKKELAYYVSGNVLEPVNCDYMFSELVNPIFIKSGEQVKVSVSVKYLDQRTKAIQISQFDLTLEKDSNWKIVK